MKKVIILIFMLMFTVSCQEEFATYVAVEENLPPIPGCCAETYRVKLGAGSVNQTGWYTLALMKGDSLVKYGDSVFLFGNLSNQVLNLRVSYSDRIPAGSYSLRAFGTSLPENVGVVSKRTAATDVGFVDIPTYNSYECISCDTIQIVYRAFIQCEVLDGVPFADAGWAGYYSGDARGFGYQYSDRFRSSQALTVTVDAPTEVWQMESEHTFGFTLQWHESVIEGGYPGPCPYHFDFDDCTYCNPVCSKQSVSGDSSGSIQSEVMNVIGDTAFVSILLNGYNPCHYGFACGISGDIIVKLRAVEINGVWEVLAAVDGVHDEYPWHELYIRKLNGGTTAPFYTYDAYNSDITGLCGQATVFSAPWQEVK